MNRFIIIDVSNLSYRALHTVGDLTHPDDDTQYTGVTYQLRQTCMQLEQLYRTFCFAFCFDSRKSIRQDAYPPYKQKRKADRDAKEASDPKAKKQRNGMIQQIIKLPKLLNEIGCPNIFGQTGFEADDQIASIIVHNPDTELVIVSSDSDLYQLLRPGVTIFNPISRKEITENSFRSEWGISPIQWSSAKAWAGCASDNIEGLAGIGELTAIKWLNGQIKPESKKYATFSDNLEVYTRNKPLVSLPYAGTQANHLKPQPSQLNWNKLAEVIGSNNYIPEGICSET